MKIVVFPFVLLHAIFYAIAAMMSVLIGKLLLALGAESMAFYAERQLRIYLTLFFWILLVKLLYKLIVR